MARLPSIISRYQKVGKRKINDHDDVYSARYCPIDESSRFDSPIYKIYHTGPINKDHSRLYYENAPVNKLKGYDDSPIRKGFIVTVYTIYPSEKR